jgi:hypothetical protein
MTPDARRAWLAAIATEHAGPEARVWLSDEGLQPDLDGRVCRPPFGATGPSDARRASGSGEAWRLDLEAVARPAPSVAEVESPTDGIPPPATPDDDAWHDAQAAACLVGLRFRTRVPHVRVGLALASDGAGLADALRPHFARFPGFHWEIEPLAGTRVDLSDVSVIVCPESAHARLPRAVTTLREEAAAQRRPLLFLGASLGQSDDADPLESLAARVAAIYVRALLPLAVDPPHAQLGFAFAALSGRDALRLPPCGPTVAVQRLDRGVRLEARYDDGASRSVSIELGAGGAIVRATEPFASRDALRLRWFASSRDADPSDLFGAFADTIAGRGMPCRALLDPLVRRARVWLRQAVPRVARSAARDFHPRVAVAVAIRASADDTGRVAQLARVCPGLFSLGVALRASTALDEACARTVRGARLARCLEPVLEAWRSAGTGPRDVARHATFVKRAPAPLDPDALREPFPRGLILDDLPAESPARTAWFAAAGTLAAQLGRERANDADRIAPFVSARGAAIGQLDADARAELFEGLAERGRTLGHWPSRDTEVVAARARSERFASDDESSFPVPRLLPSANPLLRVRPLTTQAELAAEGERMGHCVATYGPDVQSGHLLIFAVEWMDARYTASAVVLANDTLALAEVQGRPHAGPPPPALVHALTRWLARQHVRVPPPKRARRKRRRR